MSSRVSLADRLFQFIAFVIPMGEATKMLGEAFSVAKITMICLIFLALVRLAAGEMRLRRSPLDIPIILFCMAFIPSYFLSVDLVALSLVLATCLGYAVMNSLAFNALDGEKSVERIIDSFLLGCVLVTGLAFAQYATGRTLIPGAERSDLYYSGRTLVVLGTAANPNAFAAHYLIAIPMAFARLLAAGRSVRGAGWALLLAAFSVALFMTVSRAAIIGAGTGCVLVAAQFARRRGVRAAPLGLALGVGAFVAVAFFLARNPEYGFDAMFSTVADVAIIDKASAVSVRRELYIANLQLFMESPLIGVGFDMAQRMVVTVSALAESLNPHNNILGIACELGLFGLSSYLAVIALTMRCAQRASVGGGTAAIGLSGAFLAQVLFGFAHMSYIAVAGWLVPALLCLLSDRIALGRRA